MALAETLTFFDPPSSADFCSTFSYGHTVHMYPSGGLVGLALRVHLFQDYKAAARMAALSLTHLASGTTDLVVPAKRFGGPGCHDRLHCRRAVFSPTHPPRERAFGGGGGFGPALQAPFTPLHLIWRS